MNDARIFTPPNRSLQAGSSSCEPQKINAIPAGHEDCDKSINSLHSLLGDLEGRLQTVMRQEPACPQEKCEVAPPTSTVSGRLQNHARGVEAACNRIQEILRLLET